MGAGRWRRQERPAAAEPRRRERVKRSPRAAMGLVMPQVTVTWGTYQVCDARGEPYPPPRPSHCT